MDSVNKTLYIPLYGKAAVSRQGILLQDRKAEEIWAAEGFPLKGKSRSRWLAYYMGMRSAVFDRWAAERLPEADLVLHLGCGLDSRAQRVSHAGKLWLDVDFPEVMAQRRRWFTEEPEYRMIEGDLRQECWLRDIPGGRAVVILEGVSMYMTNGELQDLLGRLAKHFVSVRLLMDCYSDFAAKASRYKNPINDVGVTQVYGLDDPEIVQVPGLSFLKEGTMTPEDLIRQLKWWEQPVFRGLYAGKFAGKLYRLYEYGVK